jgi:iron complex outermembrane receptor protein
MKFIRHPLSLALSFAVLCLGSNAVAETPADTTAATATDASAASSAASTDAATATSELDTISVVSEGSTRQVQTVGREEIKKAALGTSPLKVLDKLPGVYFESADAWGTYEWSQRITFRGFARQQLGYTLDDIPLGNGAYSTDNGLSVNRSILAENIRSIEIAQGGGVLGMPSSNNLGGTIAVHTDDPNKDAGVRISQQHCAAQFYPRRYRRDQRFQRVFGRRQYHQRQMAWRWCAGSEHAQRQGRVSVGRQQDQCVF